MTIFGHLFAGGKTQEFLRPDADVLVGDFLPTPLYEEINEVTPNDIDKITASLQESEGTVGKVGFTNPVGAPALNANTKVMARARVGLGLDPADGAQYTVELRDSGGLVGQIVQLTIDTAYATYELVTDGSAVTNFDTLELWLGCAADEGNTKTTNFRCSWAEVEILY